MSRNTGSESDPSEGVELGESAWGRKLRSCPEWVTNGLIAGSALPAALILGFGVAWGISFGILAVVLIGAGLALGRLRSSREAKIEERAKGRISQREEAMRENYLWLLTEMNMAIFNIVEGMKNQSKPGLEEGMGTAQKAALGLARNLIGPAGVQMNLFTVDSVDPPVLRAGRWGQDGGVYKSDRVFMPGDRTFELAMQKMDRFVPDVAELPEDERPSRGYKTFATYPVSTDYNLFGILTVDAPEPGDLTELDQKILSYFAGVLTITFACQKGQRAIPRGQVDGSMK